MKRFFAVIFVLIFVFAGIFVVKKTQITKASASLSSGYAQVLTNDCYLLSAPKFDDSSKLFLLEQSYFVKVVQDFDNRFFCVKYMDFDGYVAKEKIQFVEEYPNFPFLSGITFDTYDIANVCLRSSSKTPNDDSNIVCIVPKSSKNLLYYGKTTGEEAIDGLGNIWYFCAYENENGQVFKGYIYAPLTRNLSSITGSAEIVTPVNLTNFVPAESLLYLNLSTKNMLVVITSIPMIAVIILLTCPSKGKEK